MKRLEGLTWEPRWMSFVGCLEGCLRYLGSRVTVEWLYGATGRAFALNIHPALCPSGPTAWQPEDSMGYNAGYRLESVTAHRAADNLAEPRRRAWDLVRRALDENVPCFGWEMAIPEYYVINGYDDKGYYFAGPDAHEATMPKPWQSLSEGEIGWLEVHAVRLTEPADAATTVREALTYAVQFARDPSRWQVDGYQAGLAAYDAWIHALEQTKVDGFGLAYNAAVWHECRGMAVGFLREARQRLPVDDNHSLDEAISAYEQVAKGLAAVEQIFPFHERQDEHVRDQARLNAAIDGLRTARDAERRGVAALDATASAL